MRRGKKAYLVYWCVYHKQLNGTWTPWRLQNAFSHLLPTSSRLSSLLQSPDMCCSFCLGPSLPLILHVSAHTSLLHRSCLWAPHQKYSPSSLFVPLSCFIFFITLSHFENHLIYLFAYYCLLLWGWKLYENKDMFHLTQTCLLNSPRTVPSGSIRT